MLLVQGVKVEGAGELRAPILRMRVVSNSLRHHLRVLIELVEHDETGRILHVVWVWSPIVEYGSSCIRCLVNRKVLACGLRDHC